MVILALLVSAALLLTASLNYLLFHTIVELFSILVAGGIFIMGWHTRRWSENLFLPFLSTAFVAIGLLDFVHTLTFKGLELIPGDDGNHAVQLWIQARSMQAFALLIAPLWLTNGRKNLALSLTAWLLVSGLGLFSVYVTDWFPVCFVPGQGLTPFKVHMEFVIIAALLAGSLHLHLHRRKMDRNLYLNLQAAQWLTILSEAAFTAYLNFADVINWIGHLGKLLAFMWIFRAIIHFGLVNPVGLLSYNLQRHATQLGGAIAQLHKAQRIGRMGHWEWHIASGQLAWSDEIYRIFGLSKETTEPTYASFLQMVHPEDHEKVTRSVAEAMGNPDTPYQVEHRIRLPDGSEKVVMEVGEVQTDHAGAPILMTGTVQDITERKRMETLLVESQQAAERANQAKSTFLANMSHEIRTPMNAIVGLTHLCLRTPLSAKQKDYLDKIHASANALLGIINDILDFSKIDAEKLLVEETDFTLDEVFGNLLAVLTIKAGENGVKLTLEADPALPAMLVGDPLRLGQVLTNLGNNAVKFTPQGEVTIGAQLLENSGQRATIRFWVQDTGIGMNEKEIKQLFQPFTQADASTTRRFGGTGLGLTISKRLVELMGGNLELQSQPGAGSTFAFTLTLGISSRKPQAKTPEDDPTVMARIAGACVLLVEDNEINQQVARELLEMAHVRTRVAPDGIAALEILATERCDGILMDLQMPRMDGFQATLAIRKRPEWSAIPIIAMTANATTGDQERCLAAGMNAHIGKPIHPPTLYATLARWITPSEPLACPDHASPLPEEEPVLPALRQLDSRAGLRNTGGNRKLYLDVLAKLRAHHAQDPRTIQEQLTRGEWADAERAAHSLKGIAGTLGAHPLAEAALALESALKQRATPETIRSACQTVAGELAALIEEIDLLLPVPEPEPAEDDAHPPDPEQLLPLIEEALQRLRIFDAAAEEPIRAMAPHCAATSLQTLYRELAERMGQYDFERSMTLLERMDESLRHARSDEIEA
ncbi:MAG: response regulator [Magnetococcales bacterium]|nr:response regulator [Magnetococcales bacterium]